MIITGKVKDIASAAAFAAGNTGTGFQLLGFLHFRECGQKLAVDGTDLASMSTAFCSVDSIEDRTSFLVDAKKVLPILKSFDGDSTVVLKSRKAYLTVTCGRSSHKMAIIDGHMFPGFKEHKHESTIVLTQDDSILLKSVLFAAPVGDVRAYLNSVHFYRSAGDRLIITASDGSLAARCNINVASEVPADINSLIPRASSIRMQKLIGRANETAIIEFGADTVQVETDSCRLVMLTDANRYPDTNRVFVGNGSVCTVGRKDLITAVNRCITCTGGEGCVLDLIISGSTINLSARERDGEAVSQEVVDCIPLVSEEMKYTVSASKLSRILDNCPDEVVLFETSGASKSQPGLLLKAAETKEWECVLMPVRR